MASAETDVTATLAGFASGLTADSIPDDIRDRVKLLFLDALASAFTGWTSPETMKVSAAASGVFGDGSTTVFGGSTASIGGATMLNSYLITARSICDMHQPTLCHITPVVVPPVVALAERDDVDGRTLLAALCAGMETNVRIGMGLDYPEFRSRGWHTPGVAGPMGGALGAARALGFDPLRAERAMGIAGSQAGGTFASFGTPTIKFHQARAAWSALIAVALEEAGFDGPTSILTARDGGIFDTFSDGGIPTLAVDGLGDDWRLMEITVRLWPAAAALQTILTIIAENDLPSHVDIDSVIVSLPSANYAMNGSMGWGSTFEATLSARYVTAAALITRGFWLEQLESEKLTDEEVDGFARGKVEVVEEASLPEGGVGLEIRTATGPDLYVTRTSPKGSPAYPASWGDVAEKLRKSAGGRVEEDRAEAIIEAVASLEELGSTRELTGLLRRT